MKINPNLKTGQFQLNQLDKKQQEDEFKDLIKNKLSNKAAKAESQTKTESQAQAAKQEDRLKQVSEKFESLFVGMMFKKMKDTGFKSKLLDGGLSEKIFEDMYYDELSKTTAKKSKLGIAEAVYNQLK
jgi:flagellar protein FlgJ